MAPPRCWTTYATMAEMAARAKRGIFSTTTLGDNRRRGHTSHQQEDKGQRHDHRFRRDSADEGNRDERVAQSAGAFDVTHMRPTASG